jgi:ABC-type branched-subunit amino acid transport system ATPase component
VSDVLVVRDLAIAFGGVQAVDSVSFTCSKGQITGLIGPNGAGKSTVLNAIAGAVSPTSGSIRFLDTELVGRAPHQIARLGIARTFQLANVFERLTVLENLLQGSRPGRADSLRGALLGRRAWRVWEAAQVEKARGLLRRCGLSELEDHYAGQLSGGQKRLVEISRTLMSDAELVLLDEPMAGVNPRLGEQIVEYLQELVASGGLSMLMVEHEMTVVSQLCANVIVMAQGQVLMEGTMDEIQRDRRVQDAYLVG